MGLTTALMILLGGVLFLSSYLFRTADAPPIASFNPKHWTPVWKQRDYFRPPGYVLMLSGLSMMCLGIVLRFALMGWDSWQM